MTCSVCQLDAGPFSDDEAAVHAVTHDQLHHRGAPTASTAAAALVIEAAAAA
jgi:predicted DNA-binding transcriptional regulator YafY